MTDIPQPYPLMWPESVERTRNRIASQFKTGLTGALDNVKRSLAKFGKESSKAVGGIVISSNVTLGVARPSDPGIAVWFMWDGEQRCVAVDRYQKVEDNLQAVHHILEARCTEMRHGGLHVVRQTFKGFVALPKPAIDWRGILGFEQSNMMPTEGAVQEKYLTAAKAAHPDKAGGSAERMAQVVAARDAALEAIGASNVR